MNLIRSSKIHLDIMPLKWNKLLCNLECDILMLSEKCCEMKGKWKTKCFIILNQIRWNSNDIYYKAYKSLHICFNLKIIANYTIT